MIKVTIGQKTYEYEDGTTLYEIAREHQSEYKHQIILAKCNGTLSELSKVLVENCNITFVTTASFVGNECYRRSATFLMLKAFYAVAGRNNIEKISVHCSVSKGYYCQVFGNVQVDDKLLKNVRNEMIKLCKRDILIQKESIPTAKAIKKFERYGMKDKVHLLKYRRSSAVNIYRIEGFEDYFYGYMAYSTGILKYFDLIKYDEGFVLQLPTKEEPEVVPEFVPRNKVYNVIKKSTDWAEMIGVPTIGYLNDKITDGSMNNIMMVQEALQESELGAVNVMTGIYTGRSPKDKFIVKDENSKDTVWWTTDEYKNDNHPATQEAWDAVKALAIKELSNKRLFVVDAFCGANKDTRMAIRFIVEVAWQAHFVTNMFIKPTAEELENFEPDFVVYNASKAKVENYKELGLNSETAVMFNITSKEQVIVNTWYGGEMKKGMFSMMNYFLPLKGMASMHCSANTDMNGENTAIFFGLSGTGKTTLSTDPKRLLIGDDEHGWDDNGVFNFEGGCYAKVINLDKESEPDIYNAIKRNALLENVTLDENGKIDFADKSVTENTRVSYPIDHIQNIVRPISSAPAAKNVIFLSADAFGVLPPVSILTEAQTQYYFLSGFTAKLAGTERGITEPTPTFSACFGQAFLELHPTKYAEELVKKMEKSGAKAYLVNTGWNGTGKRISIKDTRGIIDAILNGDIKNAPTKTIPYFNFEVPTELPGVDPAILDPRDTYADASEWETKAKDLADRFIKNFAKYEGNAAGKALVSAGPQK